MQPSKRNSECIKWHRFEHTRILGHDASFGLSNLCNGLNMIYFPSISSIPIFFFFVLRLNSSRNWFMFRRHEHEHIMKARITSTCLTMSSTAALLKGFCILQSCLSWYVCVAVMCVYVCVMFFQTDDDDLYEECDSYSVFALFKSGCVQPLPICEDRL